MSLHALKAAHLLDPLEHLTADIDTVAGGCIIKRAVISLDLPVTHCRCLLECRAVSDKVFSYDNDLNAGRTNVLLNAAVDNAVLSNVYRLGKEAGGYVCYELMALCIGELPELCTVDSIVLTDIYIVNILRDIEVRAIRDIAECLISGGSNSDNLAVLLSLSSSLLSPLTCDDVCSLTLLHKVHRNLCEHEGSTAL